MIHDHCPTFVFTILMAKAKKLTDFERSRVVELHKQGASQREVRCNKTSFYSS